ncbi:MAG: ATP-dependent DNA ligase [Patescibacteria group bacterium]
MKFKDLAVYCDKIERVSSRLSITAHLAELFQKLDHHELEKTVYLLQGRVLPPYKQMEFGMAEKTMIKAVISALNIDRSYFEKEYKKMGDIGKTVEFFKKQYISFEEKDLTILEVYDALYKSAAASGDKSQEFKINQLSLLVRQLDALSARYLVRIPLSLMRLGFSDMTVLDAYSWMIKGDKSLRASIEKAYHVRPDLGYIGRILKEKGFTVLQSIQPVLFTPIIMMRAERLSSGEEIIKQIGTCAVEPKYDGFRLQVHYHKKSGEVRLYSRSLEEVSYMYPDIIEGVQREVLSNEIIFEGEAIGYDPNTGSFLPFQDTVQRKRKYGIAEKVKEIPLKFFSFELLYEAGENYIHKPFVERRKKLESVIKSTANIDKDTIILAPHIIVSEGKKIELSFEDSISKGLEGIIAKKRDGVYQPGARAWNWIKFKRSYSSKIHDTIDCVVMGYDLGKGKRTGFGIGAFLVGIFDAEKEKYMTVAKIGTGLTDEEWRDLEEKSRQAKADGKPGEYEIDKAMECDVWIVPRIIVEIKADEITRSPVHTAGRILAYSKTGTLTEVKTPGYALRFPRLERFRIDKNIDEITTVHEVKTMFSVQEKG